MLSCSEAGYCSPGSSFTRVRLWLRTLTLRLQAWSRWAFRQPRSFRRSPCSWLQVWRLRSAGMRVQLRQHWVCFCFASAFLVHNNFANRNELLHFEKDLAIAGGMFVLMLRGAGSLSVDAYVRQNARHESSGRLTNGQIAAKQQTS